MRIFHSLLLGAAAICVALPVLGQESGGKQLVFGLTQGLRSTSNPDLLPGDDTKQTVETTGLSGTLSSKTRRAAVSLSFGVQAIGNLSEDNAIEIDRPRAGLRYSYSGPNTQLSASAGISSQNIEYLQPLELIELEDGTIVVPDDIDQLTGTGYRLNKSIGLSGSFGADRPFGLSFALRGSTLDYRDVSSASLEDRETRSGQVGARFDLTETIRLHTRIGYSSTRKESVGTSATRQAGVTLAVQQPLGEIRSGLTFSWPDNEDDRVNATVGFRRDLSETSNINFDTGVVESEDENPQWIMSLAYRTKPFSNSAFGVNFNRQVNENSSGATQLRSVLQANWTQDLTRLTSFVLSVNAVQTETFSTGEDITQTGVSARINHKLTEDWGLTMGVAHTERTDSGGDASSQSLFFSVGRDWIGQF